MFGNDGGFIIVINGRPIKVPPWTPFALRIAGYLSLGLASLQVASVVRQLNMAQAAER